MKATSTPTVTTSKQVAAINLSIDDVWELIRPCTFEWQKSIVAKCEEKANAIGSTKLIHYKDKTKQTIQVTEISDKYYRICWSTVASEPSISYTSREDSIDLTEINVLPDDVKCQTLIEWNTEFSNDITTEVIVDSNMKKRDAFKDLVLHSEDSSSNTTSTKTTTTTSKDVISDPKFDTASEIEFMAGGEGSSGAWLLTTESGKMVVKPGSVNLDNEVLAHLLAIRLGNTLKSDWKAPNLRVLVRGSDISKKLMRKVSFLTPKVENLTPIGHYIAKSQAVMLMDYCPGQQLYQISDKESVLSKDNLRILGGVLVYDLLVNNWDRIPLGDIWTSRGNPANIIFTSSNSIVLIDQMVAPILHSGNRKAYLDKVKKLCAESRVYAESLSSSSSPSSDVSYFTKSIKKVRDWIMLHSSIDIGDDGELKVRQGFCFHLNALSKFSYTPKDEKKDSSFNSFMTELTDETLSAVSEKKDEPDNNKKDKPEFWCDVCERNLKKKKKFDKHIKSSLHKMSVERKKQEAAESAVLTPQQEKLNTACKFVQDIFLAMTG